MSKILTIRLTDAEFDELKEKATKSNTTVTGFIHDKLFPISPNLLTVDRILERICELEKSGVITKNSEFPIADLFANSEYCQYFNVIPIGRTFATLADEPSSAVYKKVIYVPNTKPAKYKLK